MAGGDASFYPVAVQDLITAASIIHLRGQLFVGSNLVLWNEEFRTFQFSNIQYVSRSQVRHTVATAAAGISGNEFSILEDRQKLGYDDNENLIFLCYDW